MTSCPPVHSDRALRHARLVMAARQILEGPERLRERLELRQGATHDELNDAALILRRLAASNAFNVILEGARQ